MSQDIPKTQHAVQLTGPDQLVLNRQKEVSRPGPRQILARVEAVGLCFSDLKLLKQFTAHARKGEAVKGLPKEVFEEIPSYVPGDRPTVPGHETVVEIVAVGEEVKHYQVGERCLVQADYRNLLTAISNCAFGYNFEGALQEYVLFDERVIVDPQTGEEYLLPIDRNRSISAIALVEPWACVEDSYVTPERKTIKPGGRLLVVADKDREIAGVRESFSLDGAPGELHAVCSNSIHKTVLESFNLPFKQVDTISTLPDKYFDDIVYFGRDAQIIEGLNDKIADQGIVNVVLGGQKIGSAVSVGVGRIHYGLTRWIGTASSDASQSYWNIPNNGEIRDGDRIYVPGAGGPMGQMHVIRAICSGKKNLSIVATDFENTRLMSLQEKTLALAQERGIQLHLVNPRNQPVEGPFTYCAIMVPLGDLVADSIARSDEGCLINIFAGIPAPTKHRIDLDRYIEKRCFMFGTSGSTIEDMKIVLEKVREGSLNTDLSVDAISGMAGAIDGIRAVENRTLAGKIIVYPALRELGLIPLDEIEQHLPSVAQKLDAGKWCKAAEDELLKSASFINQKSD